MSRLARGMAARSPSLMAAAIVLCTLLAYLPAMSAGFVWDDDYHLTESVIVKDHALYRIWCTTEMANYWPISWTSYWLEHQLWGLEPAGYHVVNVLIHIACALLVFRILRRLDVPLASYAALVFAIHPLNVESVAWISQRRNVLSLLFYLAALLCYLHFDVSDRAKKWYALAIACFVLAMLSKGSAVGLPVVLLMCALWMREMVTRRDFVQSLPFFAIALIFGVMEIWFQYVRSIGDVVVRDDGFLARLAGAGWVVCFYLYKSVWPVTLCFVYPRWQIDAFDPAAYVPDLLLVIVLALCWSFRRRWGRAALFGLGYFIVALGPFLGFFNIFYMRYSYVADHYAYHAIIGMIVLGVLGGRKVVEGFGRGMVPLLPALATAAVIALGTLTWLRCHAYHDAETLWRDTLRKNPECWLAHNDLGNLLWLRDRFDEASHHFLRAIEINPHFPETHYNFGALLQEQGRTDDAVDHFRKAVSIDPDMLPAHAKLGEILQSQGLPDEAADHYRQMVRIDPRRWRVHLRLGDLLLRQQKLDEALHHCQRAVSLAPDSPEAHLLLGNVQHARAELGPALDSLETALRLEPNNGSAHYGLGTVLGDLHRFDQAEIHFRQALRLDPQDFRSENRLGLLLHMRGKLREATQHFRNAVRIKPDGPLAHFHLGNVLAARGRTDEAIDSFREALRLKPDLAEAQTRLRRALADKASRLRH